MKKNIFSALLCLLLLSLFNSAAVAADITLSGYAYFKCNFISSYMEKHGFVFIREESKTNIFAAAGADVIVMDENSMVIGSGKTARDGKFALAVPESEMYHVVVRFHENEYNGEVSGADMQNISADVGAFSTEIVGKWIDARLGL